MPGVNLPGIFYSPEPGSHLFSSLRVKLTTL